MTVPEREYVEVIPVGYIYVGSQRYLLLHPEPVITKDAWANGLLSFQVAKSGEYLDQYEKSSEEWVFTYAREILTIHPQNLVMSIGYTGKPILVWTGEWQITGKLSYRTEDEPEHEPCACQHGYYPPFCDICDGYEEE